MACGRRGGSELTLAVAAAAAILAVAGTAGGQAGSTVAPVDMRLSWETAQGREPPDRRLHLPALERREFATYGWLEAGIGANNWGTPFNGPITLADRNWQGQVNQVYLVTEREADSDGDAWAWGGRVDLLLGTDSIYTTARGLDAWPLQDYGIFNAASWDFSKDYGLAMPQLYVDVARGDFSLRLGHFYGILGYEQVPAIGNFFYTHSFSMQNSPFTFTGLLGSWQPADGVTIYSGLHDGWNNFSDPMPLTGPWAIRNPGYPGAGSNAGYLGAVVLENADRSQTLAICTTTGNEVSVLGSSPAAGSLVGNRSLITTVYTNRIADRLTYVFENDAAWQFNSGTAPGNLGQQAGLAQWYSFNQYVFWKFSDRWLGGVRLEYFRDNNGYIVGAPLRNEAQLGNPGYWVSDFAGTFWELSFALNYRPTDNLVVRPELRYDWFTPNTAATNRPFGRPLGQGIGTAGDRLGQFYAGCDFVWQW